MATNLKNLSSYNPNDIPNASGMRIGIVVSEWNEQITHALLEGASDCLKKHGVSDENIMVEYVPGSFELTLGAQYLLDYTLPELDAVICLGCVIQGETRHFDFICDAVANDIHRLGIDYATPVIFGVLTTNNQEQALERAGGRHGNKGVEAALTAIKMAALRNKLEAQFEKDKENIFGKL